jgi:hydrogenase maturation protease
MHVLIIGYGNPLRQDDGAGWVAAEALAGKVVDGATLQVETEHQLLPELAEPISAADLVIFIDASVEGEPGEIKRKRVRPSGEDPAAFSHHFGPARLLGYARELYGRFPPAYLFTVTVARLGYGEGLSGVVETAVIDLTRQIEAIIGQMVQQSE